MVTRLKAHKRRQREEAMAYDGPAGEYNPDDLVFCTPKGEVVPPSTLIYQYRKLLKAAGVRPKTFHVLRHTAATLRFLERGDHPMVVPKMLGHSTMQQTMDTYTHYLPSHGRDLAFEFDSLFP